MASHGVRIYRKGLVYGTMAAAALTIPISLLSLHQYAPFFCPMAAFAAGLSFIVMIRMYTCENWIIGFCSLVFALAYAWISMITTVMFLGVGVGAFSAWIVWQMARQDSDCQHEVTKTPRHEEELK